MKAVKTHYGNLIFSRVRNNKPVILSVAIMTTLAATQHAWATIDNTVTVTGTVPGGGTLTPAPTASENVDVDDAAPALVVTKSSTDSNVGVGDTVTYTYTVQNTGNVTLTAVGLTEEALSFDGEGTLPSPAFVASPLTDAGATTGDSTDAGGDNVWDTLAPGDTVTWEATYTVVQDDITNNGGGDGEIDNTVTASATPAAGSLGGTLSASETVTVEPVNASLTVAKYATSFGATGTETALVDVTDPLAPTNLTAPDSANVPLGDVITYTYVITNNGNVPITNISLTDDVTSSTGGTDPVPGNEALLSPNSGNSSDSGGVDGTYEDLAPGDSVTFTGTYTVVQADIDAQ